MIMKALSEKERTQWGEIEDTLSMFVYGEFEPAGIYVDYRSPEEVAEGSSLRGMQSIQQAASRAPQEYRNNHPRFDEKLGILEEAILIKAE